MDFDFNPRNLVLITEKPNKIQQRREPYAIDQKKLATVFESPVQKYAHPMTASHEVGWPTHLVKTHYGHHRTMDGNTRFVESYIMSQGKSPMKN